MLIWPPSRSTPGFSGADPAPAINEAALLVARREKAVTELADIDAAIERVVVAPSSVRGR